MRQAYNYEVLEGGCDDEEEYYTAVQEAINEGTAWKFQGGVGRRLLDAITSGRCLFGKTCAWSYYGNYIPSREEVTPGTKGSLEYVIRRCGEDWANYIKGV